MKVKNIMFAGFASAILSGICGAASAADYNLVTQGYVTDQLAGKVSTDTYAAYIEDQADVDEAQDAKIQANTDAIDGLSGIDGSGFATMQQDITALKTAVNDEDGAVAQKISTALTGYATEGYVTEELENYALKSELPTVPTNVSAFNNDAGYLTTATAGELYDAAGAAAAVDAKLSNYATTEAMNTALQGKQATIDNLDTIIAGAAAGATAVQPGALESYVTTQDLTDAGYATTEAMNAALQGKQATIDNLDTIIAGAAAGATAVQPGTLETTLAGYQAAGDYLTDTMEAKGTYLVKRADDGSISYVSVDVIGANGNPVEF